MGEESDEDPTSEDEEDDATAAGSAEETAEISRPRPRACRVVELEDVDPGARSKKPLPPRADDH